MSESITSRVVSNAPETVSRVESALDGVYDDVAILDSADGPSGVDCVIAVGPLSDEEWAVVENAVTSGSQPPLVVLASGSDADQVRDRATVTATDVVVDESDHRFEVLANRVRGMVQFRRSNSDRDQSASATHLTDLYEVATDASLSFPEKANRMLEIGLDRLDVENAHLSTIDQEPERYEIVASIGDLPISPGDLMDLPTTFCRKTIETDEVLALSHASEQGWSDDPAYERSNVECYLGSRIVVGGSLYGTVCFLDRSPHSTFSEAEQTFVSLIARWLSHELERTRREEALETLHGGMTELMRARTKTGVCEMAIGIAGDAVEASSARAWLLDDDGTTLDPVTSLSGTAAVSPLSRGESGTDRLWTAIDEGTVTTFDSSTIPQVGGDSGEPIRSEVVIPLEEFGVMTVCAETAEAFDAIDVSLLKMLGSNAVAALERTEWIEELSAAHQRARRIFESASDGLLLVDPDADEIIDCNDRAANLLGYDDPNVLQSVNPSTICHEDAERFEGLIEEVRQSGRGWAEELTCTGKDGKRIPTEVTAATIELPEGSRILGSLRDVSERKRREQALNVFNRVLRHNIRNDMNVVIGHASMIHTETSDPSLRESAAEIQRTGRKLIELGEKARTFQKVDERDTDADQVDLREILEQISAELESDYPGGTVDVAGVEDAPAAVETTVDVAFRELCENGLQHATTPEPTVSVTVSRVSDGQQFAVTISDEGPGLPSQDCAVLEGETETPLEHGSGLGLWLTNWIVRSNGATLTVVESGDQGTTIRFTFPASDADRADT